MTTKRYDDARLAELDFLTQLERGRGVSFICPSALSGEGVTPDQLQEHAALLAKRDMIAVLVSDGVLNSIDRIPWSHAVIGGGEGFPSAIEQRYMRLRYALLNDLLGGHDVTLTIGHTGRLRIARLRDELRSNKIREPFGILWDQRHSDQALAVAALFAGPAVPLSIAVLDMNGLGRINADFGHPAGSNAIKAFFHTLVAVVPIGCDIFRDGGDEVLILFPATGPDQAAQIIESIFAALARDGVEMRDGVRGFLTGSCGIAWTNRGDADPRSLRQRADDANGVAKLRAGEKMAPIAERSSQLEVDKDAV
jgi:diguanylate cyclase (GGDEF)-like protein